MEKLYGLYSGLVVDTDDPESRGRIKLESPVLEDIQFWAEPLMGILNSDYGKEHFPKVGDQVYVMFVDGSERNPVWFGGRRSISSGSSDTLSEIADKEGSNFEHYTSEVKLVDEDSTEKIGATKAIVCGQSCEVKGDEASILLLEMNGVVLAKAICPLTGLPLFMTLTANGISKKLRAE